MRAAGILLTVLALLAVQAPWIACACGGSPSFAPLLGAFLLHADAGHDHEDGHAHACCDGVAHALHGTGHKHAPHCHATFAHEHETPDEPEAPSERHDGFQFALRTLSSSVSLDAPAWVPLFDALLADASWQVIESRTRITDADPPERRNIPPAATERLLL